MHDSTTSIDVNNISVSFGGVHALRNVSLSVPLGARVGLIGPNGAGKTTLINCIAGGLTPDSGDVVVLGRSLQRLSAAQRARRGIARTFQNLELFASMTVSENVLTALDAEFSTLDLVRQGRTFRLRRERVLAALEMFEIGHYANTLAGALPYGVRKLVELSRAFAREPRFLLLDEPVAGLSDSAAFLDVLTRGIDRLGCGVLLIEHDMPTVRELCSSVYVLDAGEIIAHGTYEEVSSDRRVVDAYLGASDTA